MAESPVDIKISHKSLDKRFLNVLVLKFANPTGISQEHLRQTSTDKYLPKWSV